MPASKAFEGKPFSHQGKYWTTPPEAPYRGYTLKEIAPMPAPERLPVECAAATRARLLHDAQVRPQCDGRE
jgi:hypothetical protein